MNDRIRDARRTADRLRGRDRPGWGATLLAGIAGMVAGLATAYLFDPTRGRSRRARLGGQAAGYARSVLGDAERSGRRAAALADGLMRGAVARISGEGGGDGEPLNDATLQGKVETELFRDPSVPQGTINVNVEKGIVVLRGEIPDETTKQRLLAQASEIRRVWSVRDLLHLPGETPTGASI